MTAASSHYERQARLLVIGIASARRAWDLGRVDLLTATLATLQTKAAQEAEIAVAAMVAEQNLVAPAEARISPTAFTTASDGRPLGTLLEQATSVQTLSAMAVTQITDTGRAAAGVALAARPKMSGYIRNVGAKCCSRCAELAGRFYRYSDDFQRHVNCRCTMVATTTAGYGEHIETPDDLFRAGRITDLTGAQQKALEDGADFSRVINASRGGISPVGAGVRATTELAKKSGGRVRLTPYSIYKLASTREEAIRLLGVHRYLL